jgi:hypothetical protein
MGSAQRSVPIRRAAPERESTRITLARVLELGVRVTWREAAAIVYEAIAATRGGERTGPARVTAESCLLTRGGEVMLIGSAAQARPEVVVRLFDDLLASCSEPGRFAGAVADGTALEMLEELSQAISPKRRRVEVASVALRGLAAAADAARALADAGEQHPSADVAGLTAARAATMAPATGRRPWPPAAGPRATIPAIPTHADAPRRPPAVPAEAPSAPPRPSATLPADAPTAPPRPSAALPADAPTAPPHRSAASPTVAPIPPARSRAVPSSGRERAPRARLLALVCLVVAVAAGGVVVLRLPAPQPPAAAPPVAVITPATPPTPAGPRAEPEVPAPPDDAPATPGDLPPVFADEPVRDLRRPLDGQPPYAPAERTPPALIPSIRPPASRSDTPDTSPAPIAPADSRPAPPASAPVLPADPPTSDSAPRPALELPPVVASPSPPATAAAKTVAPASTDVPAPVVPPVEADTRAIENVLGRYRSALDTLNAGAAKAVWPAVNEKTLAKAFEALESHAVSFDRCQIEVFSVLAEAACSGRVRYVPKVGSQTPRDEPRRWRISLRKAGGGWLIDSVDAR